MAVIFYIASIKIFILSQHNKHNIFNMPSHEIFRAKFQIQIETQHQKQCPLLTLCIALMPTAQLPKVCGGNTLDSVEQFRACKVFFKARIGMQNFDCDSGKPHLQHCMGRLVWSCTPLVCLDLALARTHNDINDFSLF